MFGTSNVEIAPYQVVQQDSIKNIEVRKYENLVLASTPMTDETGRNNAFRKLFNYITGDNTGEQDIAMTAPVLMDKEEATEGTEIPMTAPVFMDDENEDGLMSFVLPKGYTIETAPKPTNPDVSLSELKNYTVAVIRFSGRLTQSNINKHKDILLKWIDENSYPITGEYKAAGYDAPFTLPPFRRNEVLIPIEKR